jgi:hypothetical protein
LHKYILHFLFADDLKILYSYNIKDFDKSILQNAINDIIEWCDENSMDLSTPKTHHIQFGKPNDAAIYSIKEMEIERTETVRDLGLFISSNLSFSMHIDNIVSNATKKLFSITKKVVTNNKNILIKVFNTYIRPSLEHDFITKNSKEKYISLHYLNHGKTLIGGNYNYYGKIKRSLISHHFSSRMASKLNKNKINLSDHSTASLHLLLTNIKSSL